MPEVLLEVCPSCDGMMKAGQYICKTCRRQPGDPMVLVADKPEFKPKRYNKTTWTDSICGNCTMLIPCRARVRLGGWCYCEIPDELDYLFVSQNGTVIKLLERRSSVTGRFEKGHVPWNIGMSDFDPSPETHFKSGDRPKNTAIVGTEVKTKGYIRRKVSEPNVWRQRSHIIWEEHHGQPLSEGWIVRHKDGDPLNDDPNNLEAMPRSRNLTETLKDPVILKRKKERLSHAMRERWKEYRSLKDDVLVLALGGES